MIKKIRNFFIYILFGNDLTSYLLFIIFILMIYIIIQLTYPPLFSVVVTPSMEHKNFVCEKYEKYNLTCSNFSKFPYPAGINAGDIVIILPVIKEINVGDVVLYKSKNGSIEIFHRVIGKYYEDGKEYYILMGDNNLGPLLYENETKMDKNRIIGVGVIRIPFLGLLRLINI